MFKKKTKAQTVSVQSDKKNVKPENPKRKKRRSRHLFRLVIFVSVCALAWATYDNLKNNVAKTHIKTTSVNIQSAKNIPVNPDDVDTSDVKKRSDLLKNTSQTKNDVQLVKALKNNLETTLTHETVVDVETSTTPMPQEVLPQQDITVNVDVSPAIPEISEVVEAQTITEQIDNASTDTQNYSLKDALVFRDHFLSEKPCGDDFRKLILSNNKQHVVQEVIRTTSYFCLTTNNVYGELNNIFNKNKKNALIKYYDTQDGKWTAKLKAVALNVIQIRNLNPVSDTVPDILDRIQNTLEEKNIGLTIETIMTLPQYLQPEFEPFLEKAKNYADASVALENLILSYAKGE